MYTLLRITGSNYVIYYTYIKFTRHCKSIWLKYYSITRNPGSNFTILVPPVTQLFRSKWLHFFFQKRLFRSIASQVDAIARIWAGLKSGGFIIRFGMHSPPPNSICSNFSDNFFWEQIWVWERLKKSWFSLMGSLECNDTLNGWRHGLKNRYFYA